MTRTARIILITAALAIAAGAVVWRKQQAAHANKAAATSQASSAAAAAVLELAPSDLSTVALQTLTQTVPVSGTVKAVQQAQVRALVSATVLEVMVREGDTVKKGQVLAKLDEQDYAARVAAQNAAVAQAQAQLAITQRSVDNNKSLLDKGFISSTAYDTSLKQLQAAQANVDAAQQQVNLAKKALADTVIMSPMAGVIAEKGVNAGDKISPDGRAFLVVNPSQLELEATLNPSDVQGVNLRGASVLLDGNIKTQISRVNPALNTARQTVAYAPVPTTAASIGTFISGKLSLKSVRVLAVPQAAVRDNAGKASVYVLAQGKLSAVDITTGSQGEDADGNRWLEVKTGVQAGDLIVAKNLGALRTGPAAVAAATASKPKQ